MPPPTPRRTSPRSRRRSNRPPTTRRRRRRRGGGGGGRRGGCRNSGGRRGGCRNSGGRRSVRRAGLHRRSESDARRGRFRSTLGGARVFAPPRRLGPRSPSADPASVRSGVLFAAVSAARLHAGASAPAPPPRGARLGRAERLGDAAVDVFIRLGDGDERRGRERRRADPRDVGRRAQEARRAVGGGDVRQARPRGRPVGQGQAGRVFRPLSRRRRRRREGVRREGESSEGRSSERVVGGGSCGRAG